MENGNVQIWPSGATDTTFYMTSNPIKSISNSIIDFDLENIKGILPEKEKKNASKITQRINTHYMKSRQIQNRAYGQKHNDDFQQYNWGLSLTLEMGLLSDQSELLMTLYCKNVEGRITEKEYQHIINYHTTFRHQTKSKKKSIWRDLCTSWKINAKTGKFLPPTISKKAFIRILNLNFIDFDICLDRLSLDLIKFDYEAEQLHSLLLDDPILRGEFPTKRKNYPCLSQDSFMKEYYNELNQEELNPKLERQRVLMLQKSFSIQEELEVQQLKDCETARRDIANNVNDELALKVQEIKKERQLRKEAELQKEKLEATVQLLESTKSIPTLERSLSKLHIPSSIPNTARSIGRTPRVDQLNNINHNYTINTARPIIERSGSYSPPRIQFKTNNNTYTRSSSLPTSIDSTNESFPFLDDETKESNTSHINQYIPLVTNSQDNSSQDNSSTDNNNSNNNNGDNNMINLIDNSNKNINTKVQEESIVNDKISNANATTNTSSTIEETNSPPIQSVTSSQIKSEIINTPSKITPTSTSISISTPNPTNNSNINNSIKKQIKKPTPPPPKQSNKTTTKTTIITPTTPIPIKNDDNKNITTIDNKEIKTDSKVINNIEKSTPLVQFESNLEIESEKQSLHIDSTNNNINDNNNNNNNNNNIPEELILSKNIETKNIEEKLQTEDLHSDSQSISQDNFIKEDNDIDNDSNQSVQELQIYDPNTQIDAYTIKEAPVQPTHFPNLTDLFKLPFIDLLFNVPKTGNVLRILIRHDDEGDASGLFVHGFIPYSRAEEQGLIKVGDEILSVNNVDVKGKQLDDVITALINHQDEYIPILIRRRNVNTFSPTISPWISPRIPHFEIEQSPRPFTTEDGSQPDDFPDFDDLFVLPSQNFLFEVPKTNGQLRVLIRHDDDGSHKGLFVHGFRPNSKAEIQALLKIGDEIIEVDGVNIAGGQIEDLIEILQLNTREFVSLLICRRDNMSNNFISLE